MNPVHLLILAMFIGVRPASANESGTLAASPTHYWNIGESYIGYPSADQYNIRMQVKDLTAAENIFDKVLRKNGCERVMGQNYEQPGAKSKMLQCTMDRTKAEAVAQKIIRNGGLVQYNVNHMQNTAKYDQVRAAYKEVNAEFKANTAALKSMPAATSMFMELLAKYSAYISGYEAIVNKATISVFLTLPHAEPFDR